MGGALRGNGLLQLDACLEHDVTLVIIDDFGGFQLGVHGGEALLHVSDLELFHEKAGDVAHVVGIVEGGRGEQPCRPWILGCDSRYDSRRARGRVFLEYAKDAFCQLGVGELMPLRLHERLDMLEGNHGILREKAQQTPFEFPTAPLGFWKLHVKGQTLWSWHILLALIVSTWWLNGFQGIQNILLAHHQLAGKLDGVILRQHGLLDGSEHDERIGKRPRAPFGTAQVMSCEPSVYTVGNQRLCIVDKRLQLVRTAFCNEIGGIEIVGKRHGAQFDASLPRLGRHLLVDERQGPIGSALPGSIPVEQVHDSFRCMA